MSTTYLSEIAAIKSSEFRVYPIVITQWCEYESPKAQIVNVIVVHSFRAFLWDVPEKCTIDR
jgi:hypothetical protein